MDLTPELLRNVEFADARKGGYVHDDVDHFLDKAADALAEQQQQRQVLEARLRAAETRLANTPAPTQTETSDTEETLRRTLILAQRTADAAIEEAKAEAAKRIAQTKDEAARILQEAEEAVRRDVGAKRDQLRSEIAALEVERTSLHDRISRLRGYVETERSRLRGQLETIVANIDQEYFGIEPAEVVDDVPLVSADTSVHERGASQLRLSDQPELVDDQTHTDPDLSKLPAPPIEPLADGLPGAFDPEVEDIGPPTEAHPVIVPGSGAGAPHLDELRRVVSQDEDSFDDEDAAMAAFFDQDESDDDGDEKRRFGRRR